jgi:hypothetical protein
VNEEILAHWGAVAPKERKLNYYHNINNYHIVVGREQHVFYKV